jgi:tetratricopeptide (TPR) repeat protein
MHFTVMKHILTSIFLTFATILLGCGNEYGMTLSGERLHTPIFYLSDRYRQFDASEIRIELNAALAKRSTNDSDFKNESNIALYHMKLGKVEKAIEILEPLAEQYPDEYIIVANLGTAYELNGQFDKALECIKKGYAMNPNSHYGSEWIHIKILEAKIRHGANSNWFRRNPIITVEELHEAQSQSSIHYRNQLAIQIRTRVPFTPAPNPVIANLLRTYAAYCEKYSSYENALMARIYVLEFENVGITLIRDRDALARLLDSIKNRSDTRASLSPIFIDLLETGAIDPNLLLFAVDTVALQLEEADIVQFKRIDSLQRVTDSLQRLTGKKRKRIHIQPAGQNGLFWGMLFGTLGLIFGILIATISRRRNR